MISIRLYDSMTYTTVDIDFSSDGTSDPPDDHSAWIYMSMLYTFFTRSKCIYVETTEGAPAILSNWWTFASQRLLDILESAPSNNSLCPQLIVENPRDGYSGLRRRSNGSNLIKKPGVVSDYCVWLNKP